MERMTALGPTFIGMQKRPNLPLYNLISGKITRCHLGCRQVVIHCRTTFLKSETGGSSADITTQMVRTAHEQLGLETCMHLTCTNMPVEQVEQALADAKEHGCENILALRGDPPHGQKEWVSTEGGFEHAIDLIQYIRKHYGDHFDIAIAGFPEGHPQAPTRELELQYIKNKVDAGANFIVTQMFYDADGE